MNLTEAELERLAILAEECAEVQQIIGKIIRHGYESYHPDDLDKTPNRKHLERELGDLAFIINFCHENEDVNLLNLTAHIERKSQTIQQYLHHNVVTPTE